MFSTKYWTLVVVSVILLAACSGSRKTTQSTVEQGLRGYVREVSGNQMPSPDQKPAEPKGLKTTLYVYELTKLSQVKRMGEEPLYSAIGTRQVATVETDDKGYFQLALEPGRYSLFVKVNDKFFANLFDGEQHIYPVTVEKGKVEEVSFLVNINATY